MLDNVYVTYLVQCGHNQKFHSIYLYVTVLYKKTEISIHLRYTKIDVKNRKKKNIFSTLVRIPWYGTIVCAGVASGEPWSHGMPTKFLQKYCLLTINWARCTMPLVNTFGIIGLRPQASEKQNPIQTLTSY